MKIRSIIVLLLAMLTAALTPLQVFADAQPVYIADVMVGTGESADEAKKALTDAGFTVLDRNLNEGAGSVYKTDKFVYVGYKTTTDRGEAITDLAVMNMNGGYSFSDYEALMDKYRDSQIKPFIDKFIATIKEYRENYESDIPGNKAKADFAYSILSHIHEDDTDNNMGDLLLNLTKEERGLSDDEYKALQSEDKLNTVNLTKTIMQGNAQVVYLIEQMLAISADTNETTWLERLSELGPDGLDEKYAEAGVRPTDAKREMASLYNDVAKQLLSGWVDLRSELLAYDAQFKASDAGEATDTVDADDVDFAEKLNFDVAEIDKDGEGLDVEDMPDHTGEIIGAIEGVMKSGQALSEGTEGSDVAGIYGVLNETPYGDGTLYDFFTLDYSEVSGDNIAALYPLASTLTGGQIAAMDFLPLKLLVQIGATTAEAFEQFSPENSNLFEGLDFVSSVSVYLNVNRELFGDKVALTSEALREGLDKNGWMTPDSNLLGLSRLTTLSWAATGFFGAMTVVSVLKVARLPAQFQKASEQLDDIVDCIVDWQDNCKLFIKTEQDFFQTTRVEFYTTGKASFPTGVRFVKDIVDKADIGDLDDFSELGSDLSGLGIEEVPDTLVKEYEFSGEFAFKSEYKNVQELEDHFTARQDSLKAAQGRWNVLEVVFGVVFAILALVSVGLTVYDLYRYYNIDYIPIPKYIVDEADITSKDADGNQIVVRNDAAYYTVAKTNRPEDHEQYEALKDYADLNGDVGREWLALYYTKSSAGSPIIADSFTVVTGSTSIPDGYENGIHMFGSSAAANLTDSRYTYNDDLNGIYVYFKTDESAPSADTASVFSGGAIALVGTGSTLAGAALGAAAVSIIKKKKGSQTA